MDRLTYETGDDVHATALNAIDDAIEERRRFLASTSAHTRPDLAVNTALRLRQLELAAWNLGENIEKYLPAVYRTPAIAR